MSSPGTASWFRKPCGCSRPTCNGSRILAERAHLSSARSMPVRSYRRFSGRPRKRLGARKLIQVHLHARAIVRDGADVFIGSQSLRGAELDTRREIGVVFSDVKIAGQLVKLFNQDWELAQPAAVAGDGIEESVPAAEIAKKVAKAVTNGLPPMVPVLEAAVNEVAGNGVDIPLNSDKLQDTVKDAVKHAVKEAVRDVVEKVATLQEPGKGT